MKEHNQQKKSLRIAAFGGFRSIPPQAGGAGSDKFALELYPRIVANGHQLIAYTRIYPGDKNIQSESYKGVQIKAFETVSKAGFDTLVHSFKATWDIIFHNTADCVHLHSGANSLWAIPLRLAGKKVIVTQFAMDWKRDKWPWYGKLFYLLSNYLTAYIPNQVVFDNVFTKEYFEKKYNNKYEFIAYGSEVPAIEESDILQKLGIKEKEYFLFVGRFIPDKGIHLLIDAYEKVETSKKLVLIGGSPNPDNYEAEIKKTNDNRVLFPGYIYGNDINFLIKNAYVYIQPSIIEGLSPMILTVMGIGTPLICSDIKENLFITKKYATVFESNNRISLQSAIDYSILNLDTITKNSIEGKKNITNRFNWDKITNQYIEIFKA